MEAELSSETSVNFYQSQKTVLWETFYCCQGDGVHSEAKCDVQPFETNSDAIRR
jgi:hypothetical protein